VLSWNQPYRQVLHGRAGPQFALRGEVSVRQVLGPRLTPDDIIEYSRLPNCILARFDYSSGLTQYRGIVPVRTDFPFTRAEHQRFASTPWPAADRATLVVAADWQAHSPELRAPPQDSAPAAKAALDAAFAEIVRRRKKSRPDTTHPPS